MKSNSNSAQTLNELQLKIQLFRCYWNRGRSCHLCWWLEVAVGATRRTINKRQRQYITKKVNILLTAFKLSMQRKWSQQADVLKSCLSSIWCQKWACLLECNFFLFLFLLSYCSPSLNFFSHLRCSPLISFQIPSKGGGGWTSSKHVPDHVPAQCALTRCSTATEAMLWRWCSPRATHRRQAEVENSK